MAFAKSPSHVISLLGPTASPPVCEGLAARRLHLVFNDVVEPGEGLILPAAEHVDAILAFAEEWQAKTPMLIHCWAGISRSTATAFILACARTAPGHEADIALRLRAASPTAHPNRLLIALADEALGRDGAMVRAVAAMPPGEEAEWGKPFELQLT